MRDEDGPALDVWLPVGTCMNRTNKESVCNKCGNDGWLAYKAQKARSAGDSLPCRWCEWGRTIVARFEADGRRGEWFGYEEDEMVIVTPDTSAPPPTADQRTRIWLDNGFERLADGSLVEIRSGKVMEITLPEKVLPPKLGGGHPAPMLSSEDQSTLPPPPDPEVLPIGFVDEQGTFHSLVDEEQTKKGLDRLPPLPDNHDEIPF